jgi:hypothetical protein
MFLFMLFKIFSKSPRLARHQIKIHPISIRMSATMKALVSVEGKAAEVNADVPIPQPGEGEILVKVHTVAQNPTDWKAVAMVRD